MMIIQTVKGPVRSEFLELCPGPGKFCLCELLLLLWLTPVKQGMLTPSYPGRRVSKLLRLSLLPSRSCIIQTVAVVSPSALKHQGFAVVLDMVNQPCAKGFSECEVRDGLCQGKWGLSSPLEALGCNWMFASLVWSG